MYFFEMFGRKRKVSVAEHYGLKEKDAILMFKQTRAVVFTSESDVEMVDELFPNTDAETRAKILLFAKSYHLLQKVEE